MVGSRELKHSLIFFFGVLAAGAVPSMSSGPMSMFCLVLIGTLGVSHGGLDHLKGRQLLRTLGRGGMLQFYLAYIGIAVATMAAWYVWSAITLAVFLLIASFHFGKEDLGGFEPRVSLIGIAQLVLKGSIVISAPMLFHPAETLSLFHILGFEFFNDVPQAFWGVSVLAAFGANLYLGFMADQRTKGMLLLDFGSVVILNTCFQPLVAFSLYFCFLHSIRHTLLSADLLDSNIRVGLMSFYRSAWGLTLIVAIIGGLVTQNLLTLFAVDEAVARVVFIGLAGLTLPHFMLELAHDRWVVPSPSNYSSPEAKARGRHVAAGLKMPAAVNRFCQGDSGVSLSKSTGQTSSIQSIGEGLPLMEKFQ